jgi:hypothetical protein
MHYRWRQDALSLLFIIQIIRQGLDGGNDFEDLIVDGKIILKWILKEIGLKDVDWVHLPQDMA